MEKRKSRFVEFVCEHCGKPGVKWTKPSHGLPRFCDRVCSTKFTAKGQRSYDAINKVVYEVKPDWLISKPSDEMRRKESAACTYLSRRGLMFKYVSDIREVACEIARTESDMI